MSPTKVCRWLTVASLLTAFLLSGILADNGPDLKTRMLAIVIRAAIALGLFVQAFMATFGGEGSKET